MNDQTELEKRAARFLWSFELVFDNDWMFTKDTICDEYLTAASGTFLNPSEGVGGDGSNRENLLNAWLDLRSYMISEGIYSPELLE